MARTRYHVTTRSSGGWKVRAQGNTRASGVHGTKTAAVKQARRLAKAQPLGQVIIHRKDGTFQTEHTYGRDPHPPEG